MNAEIHSGNDRINVLFLGKGAAIRRKFWFMVLCTIVWLLIPSCKEDDDDVNGPQYEGLIAYRSTADHNYGEIYVLQASKMNWRRVSALGSGSITDMDYQPLLSPDGTRVAWLGFGSKLYVAQVDSGTPRMIANLVEHFRWSPDGKKLYWIPNDMQNQIHQCNSDGSGYRQLTLFRDSLLNYRACRGLFWMGDTALYTTFINPDHTRKLVQIDLQKGTVINELHSSVRLDPDGNYHSELGKICWVESDSIRICDIRNGTTHSVYGPNALFATLSPDGSRVAYTYNQYDRTEIATCNSHNGFNRFKITEGIVPDNKKYKANFAPCWYDNKNLLYGALDLYIITDHVIPAARILAAGISAGAELDYKKP